MIGTTLLRNNRLNFRNRRWIISDNGVVQNVLLVPFKVTTDRDECSRRSKSSTSFVGNNFISIIPDRDNYATSFLWNQQRKLSFSSMTTTRNYSGSRYNNESSKNLDVSEASKHHHAHSKHIDIPPAPSTTTLRSRIRLQASCYRDNAVDKYHEFRDSPGATAKAGAKSFGAMLKNYGPVFIGVYFSVYITTLMTLWAGVESTILDPISLFHMINNTTAIEGAEAATKASTVQLVLDFMNNHNFTKPYSYIVEENPSIANLGVAWIAVKFTEPIRLAVALSITPRIARYFGYGPKDDVDV